MASKQIWVVGEALIDLVPQSNSLFPFVGGGPANTAKALSRLGCTPSFIGGISSDDYGSMIEAELAGVELKFALRSNLPTALAIVSLDESGSASYEFKLENTATFDFRKEWLPSGSPELLHIGTLATVIEPGSSALFQWAIGLECPIVFDPNIRPIVMSNKAKYRGIFKRWVEISNVVKMSHEDLSWLGFTDAEHILDFGPKLVVVTHGADGISGHTTSGSVSVPGVRVDVLDTVGAGDTVGAVIVEGLLNYGIESLMGDKLFEVLTRAARAAAITCSRVGANPPTLAELE